MTEANTFDLPPEVVRKYQLGEVVKEAQANLQATMAAITETNQGPPENLEDFEEWHRLRVELLARRDSLKQFIAVNKHRHQYIKI